MLKKSLFCELVLFRLNNCCPFLFNSFSDPDVKKERKRRIKDEGRNEGCIKDEGKNEGCIKDEGRIEGCIKDEGRN